MMKALTGVIIIALLSGCKTTYVDQQFNREGKELNVTVFRTEPSTFSKKEGTRRKGKAGEAIYYLNDPSHECKLTIMSSGKIPLDGKYTLTLGHELMHCLYGDYHD